MAARRSLGRTAGNTVLTASGLEVDGDKEKELEVHDRIL
jgi:hypothetical protein